jgi:hypothetical protein
MKRLLLVSVVLLGACAEDAGQEYKPFISEVIDFEPGLFAGFGQDQMPDVILGPPQGQGSNRGSLDVLSLGVGGEIIVDMGTMFVDGPGVDLIVFENAFYAAGNPDHIFAEAAEVSVSSDLRTWYTFECQPEIGAQDCAGQNPVLPFDHEPGDVLMHEKTGGDGFDLETLGISQARFVRIRDLSSDGVGTTAGFDLDAIGWVYEKIAD